MTSAWTDMARTALTKARLWRSAVRRSGLAEADLGFAASDVIVLSLLLDLRRVDAVVCAEESLRAVLLQALADDSACRVLGEPDGTTHIRLARLGDVGANPTGVQKLEVAYGLRDGLLLSDCARIGHARLRPLSSVSAALWQCGLALVLTEGEAATEKSIVADLAQSLRGEWIDPLVLYEQVQRLSARLRHLGHADEVDADAQPDRVAELEREIASLKRAALVSQHLMLVDAAERMRDDR